MSTIVSAPPALIEVYRTIHGAVFQNDSERCWIVDFAGKSACFDYRCLLKLRTAIYRIDIEERLMDSASTADIEIIFICACDHSYVLSLSQVIALRQLLEGTFVMLELNQIIHDRLHRVASLYLD